MQFSKIFESTVDVSDGVFNNKQWRIRPNIDFIVRYNGKTITGISYGTYEGVRAGEVRWQYCTLEGGWTNMVVAHRFFAELELLRTVPVTIEGLPDLPGVFKKDSFL